jgi:hypothetical protein
MDKGHMTDRADRFAGRVVDKFRKAVPKPVEPMVPLTGDVAVADLLAKLTGARKRLRETRGK